MAILGSALLKLLDRRRHGLTELPVLGLVEVDAVDLAALDHRSGIEESGAEAAGHGAIVRPEALRLCRTADEDVGEAPDFEDRWWCDQQHLGALAESREHL